MTLKNNKLTNQVRYGKTVFFKKKSEKESKTCHYYYNSIDNSLGFEETIRPGMEAVISKDCNYLYYKG